tara:strand:- start:46 stop:579 length:534 start_codon:yes stop_codon:yes gene_type:complete
MNDSLLEIQGGLLLKNDDHLNEINNRILDRRFPDVELKPNLEVRPVSTKYSLFPVIDLRKEEPLSKEYLEHYVESNFNPCTSMGPVLTCQKHVDIENELRGQNTPLHKGDLAIKHIPKPQSNMYRSNITNMSPQPPQPHPLLFNKFQFEQNSNASYIDSNIGKDTFNNNTRTQLRQI